LGSKALEANYYHVMSRTCGGEIYFYEVEKEALKRVLWRVAAFCGVEVLTYCVMSKRCNKRCQAYKMIDRTDSLFNVG
jgi:REP element-mobilizing transposase RayT